MSANKVLCYGGIAVESFIELPYQPKPGIAHIICDEYYRIGGGAANVAEWLASWGVPTRLSGYVIGYDRYGDQLWGWLSEYPNLDLRYLQRQKEINTLISRTIPFPDGNKYLLCSGYAEVTLTPPTPKLLEDIQILEIAFYFRQARGNAASAEIARLAAGRGITLVAMDLLAPDAETVPLVDVIINSAASIIEQFPSVNVGEHSKELQAASKGIVITTDGSQQIHAIDRDGTHYSLLPPKVTAVETTGAGDSFRAGIVYGLLQQWSLSQSLRWAAAVSAMQVQRSLAQDRPPATEKIASLAERIEVRRMD